LFYFDDETVWFEGVNFFEEKVHPGDLAGGFSDLEMTWLLYCAGAAAGASKFLTMAAPLLWT